MGQERRAVRGQREEKARRGSGKRRTGEVGEGRQCCQAGRGIEAL